jgi:predicted metal-dependent peptidase
MTSPAPDSDERLKGIQLRIRGDHPFFGTLALFADFVISDQVETAATDGKRIWFNPAYIRRLGRKSLCGLFIHELMHLALRHADRRHTRDPQLWNVAADVVVNGMIRSGTDYSLPAGGVEIPKLAHLSVDEVYEQLCSGRHKVPEIALIDLLPTDDLVESHGSSANDTISHQISDDLRRYWNSALQQASAVARRIGRGYGKVGLASIREYEQIFQSELDWKHLLWEHIVRTPYDFSGFDRRFLYKKTYLEESVSEAIEIWICIDSSASVGSRQLGMFMAEIQTILDIYPQIQGKLFFADVELFGPYPFGQGSAVPPIVGGGGTSFVPFFERVAEEAFHGCQPICVYFTDGLGEFPPIEVDAPVLWVVVDGGLESTGFPFGTVARLISSDSGELEGR